MAAQLVRQCVSEQLQKVLGNSDESVYIAPVSGSSAASMSHLQSPRIHDIGYNTLTRVVREELRRFRADTEAAGHSQHQLPTSDVLQCSSRTTNNSATRGGKGAGDYEEIDDLISVINERDQVTARGGDVDDDDDAPQHRPPPPPIRLDASSPTTDHADNVSGHLIVTGQPSDSAEASVELAGDSVRQRRTPIDNESVIQLLERIEQSTAELDSSFTALVNVGFRCPGDWQRLARELPICRPVKLARHIARIEARYRDDVKQQAAAALAEWRSYQRNKATLGELVEALKRCDLLEEAHFLDSVSQESAT